MVRLFMKKRVNEWLKLAKVDLDSVIKLLEDSNLTQSAAFHCQQSIEKSFKALLEEQSGTFIKTHDLLRLYGLIEESGVKLNIDEDILDSINAVYIESRYPSDIGLIPEGKPKTSTIKTFYNLSESIYSQIVSILDS